MQVSEPWLSACAQVSAVSAWHVTPSWLRVLPCLACLGMLAPAVVSVGAAMQQHISTRLSAIQGEPGLVSNGPVAAATATSASSVSPGHAAASIACAAQGLTAVQAEVQRLLHNSLCFTAPMLSGLSSVCLHRVPQDTDDEHKLAQAQMAFATSTLGFTPYCSADALVTDGQPAALASVLAASKKMDARSRELLRQLQAPSAGPQVVKQLGKYLQAASALSDSMAAISCRTDSVCQNPQVRHSLCVCVCVCVCHGASGVAAAHGLRRFTCAANQLRSLPCRARCIAVHVAAGRQRGAGSHFALRGLPPGGVLQHSLPASTLGPAQAPVRSLCNRGEGCSHRVIASECVATGAVHVLCVCRGSGLSSRQRRRLRVLPAGRGASPGLCACVITVRDTPLQQCWDHRQRPRGAGELRTSCGRYKRDTRATPNVRGSTTKERCQQPGAGSGRGCRDRCAAPLPSASAAADARSCRYFLRPRVLVLSVSTTSALTL
jgi:hypothetical protein